MYYYNEIPLKQNLKNHLEIEKTLKIKKSFKGMKVYSAIQSLQYGLEEPLAHIVGLV